MKLTKTALVLALVCAVFSPALAVKYYSVRSGRWTQRGTWSQNRVPSSSTDTVIVRHTVQYDAGRIYYVSRVEIEYGGILTATTSFPLYTYYGMRNDGTLRWSKLGSISVLDFVNTGTVESMAGATVTVRDGSGGLTNSGSIDFSGGNLVVGGTRAGLNSYGGVIAMGTGNLTVSNSGEFTNEGALSSTSGSMTFPAGMMNKGSLSSVTGTITLTGTLTNTGTVTLGTTSLLVLTGAGNSAVSSAGPLFVGRLKIDKSVLTDAVTLNCPLGVLYGGTGPALELVRGTLQTNGQNLAVDAGEFRGTANSRLVVTGQSMVSLFYLNQGAAYPASVSVSGSPTLSIRKHDLGGAARFEVGGGSVSYTGPGSLLAMTTVSGNGGWFAGGGTVSFSGDVSATSGTVFQATGAAQVSFIGSTNSTVTLHNSSSGVTNVWDLNKLVVEKTGAGVVFSSGTGALSRSVTAAGGVTVKSGSSLTLGGVFASGQGYSVASLANEGSLTQGADVYVAGDWVSSGGYAHGSRLVAFSGAGEHVLLSAGAGFYDITIDKASGSVTLSDGLRLERNLTINSGTFLVGRNTLTLGTNSGAGSVKVNGGRFSAVGEGGVWAKVAAASKGFPYSFSVESGASIAARRATFQWMDQSGIRIVSGASVDPTDNFSACHLDHGDASGPMLKIENSQIINDIANLSFSGTTGYNIEKLNTSGKVTVSYGGGSRWGEDYDNDPNNLVDWVTGARRDVGVSAVLSPADTVCENASVYPKVSVSNYGSMVETFGVRVTISDGKDGVVFDSVEQVVALGVDETRTFTFSQYYWRAGPQQAFTCRAESELGPDEDPTNDYAVKDIIVVSEKPASFFLLRPEDGQGGRPVADTLVWSKSLRADGYHVLLDSMNPPAETVGRHLSDTVFAYSGLKDGRAYYWSITARNPGGSTESDVHTFSTMFAPAQPQLSSPMNGAPAQGTSGTLTWLPASGAAGYDVYLDSLNPPGFLRSANQTGTTFGFSGLVNDKTYFWRVAARNAGGVSISPVWNFSTITAKPGTFSLSTPPSGSTGLPLAGFLTWRPAARAVTYDVYLDRYAHPVTRIGWDVADTVCPYTYCVTNDKKYYWRVVAKNAGGATLCSSTFNFTTEPVNTAPDVAASVIHAPSGVLDVNTTVFPAVTVANTGPVTTSLKVWLSISGEEFGIVYRESTLVSDLAPGLSWPVSFSVWDAPRAAGIYAVRCSVFASGDLNPVNDTLGKQISVVLPPDYDASVVRVNAPIASLDTAAVVIPRVTVKNSGVNPTGFIAFLSLFDQTGAPVYEQSTEVPELNAGQTFTALFPEWPKPHLPGPYTLRCSTYLAGDGNPGNDTVSGTFSVTCNPIHDVGVKGIFQPSGSVSVGTVVLPAVKVVNYETYDAACDLRMTIKQGERTVYEETEFDLVVRHDDSLTVFFSVPWTASPGGRYSITAYTILEDDAAHGNDTLSSSCYVVAEPGWSTASPMLQIPSPLAPKDGAWLAYNRGNGLIYSAKGNKTVDFYCYDPSTDAWTKRRNIPREEERDKVRLPSKGCVGVTDGENNVYMTKGSNSLGFWRYDISGDSWQRMPWVPLGKGKKVKGGTDAVFVTRGESGYVYLLKGCNTEFYRFNVQARRWDTLESVPYVEKPKYDKGSFLVYDGADAIYAHQAKYDDGTNHYMFRYNLTTQKWSRTPLHGMPLAGLTRGGTKLKKCKDGACGDWYAGSIFALKGGNTGQFYRYFVARDTWDELDTMPQLGRGSDKPKRVGAGADIVSVGDGLFYALKGGKSYELWAYTIPVFDASFGPFPAGKRNDAGLKQTRRGSFAVLPNPIASGLALVRFDSPQTRPVVVGVYDALGRLVLSRVSAAGPAVSHIPLDTRGLASGVYLVRVNADVEMQSRKLVIQR